MEIKSKKVKTPIRKFIQIIKSRFVILAAVILVQFLLIAGIIIDFGEMFQVFDAVARILSVFIIAYIMYDRRNNPAYKIALIIPLILFPLVGGIFCFLFMGDWDSMKPIKRLNQYQAKKDEYLKQDKAVTDKIKLLNRDAYHQTNYLLNSAKYPVYDNTTCKYFRLGEEMFEALKADLRKAQKYIFMEYFIIDKGKMWDEILEILKEKAAAGVEVRVMYDDIGTVMLLPKNYDKYLESFGIKCVVFNRLSPLFSIWYNNRNHRKMTIIDGKIAYTGGINIADEYINEIEKHGHWKDVAVKHYGEAVWSFVYMYLSVWCPETHEDEDFLKYKGDFSGDEKPKTEGFVQPYDDVPTDDDLVGEWVYINMTNRANKYIYICTPYFIVDNETVTALSLAAKSGVDVRIITPHVADKWYVHIMTQSYYKVLIENGVKVYEYTPGFIHAKTMVCDDKYAVVGTINFDYRSLYLHLECASLIYNDPEVLEVKADFLETLEKSQEMTLEFCKKIPWHQKLIGAVLSAIAPLM